MSAYDSADDKKLLERARRCFKVACDAESKQREREKEDLLFQIPENQWSDAAKRERAGDAQTPARPMLSINLLQQPQQLVYNQAARAKLGVNLHPVSEDADDELAEIKQGLYRRIERDGMAEQARLWALARAEVCGRGWYRVNTQWDEDGDDPWDQEIVFERILHQDTVYMDPSAQKPDFSDAEWAFVAVWKSKRAFRREFPEARGADVDSMLDWGFLATEAPDWINAAADDDDEKGILVAEYWYKEIEREVLKSPDGRERPHEAVKVYCAKVTGFEVLEVQEWNGRYIPLIPVLGIERQPVNGERRWEGMIRPARDGQMLYNYAASTLVERMALEPKAPFIGAEGQFEGHETDWKLANIRNLPFLEYKPVALGDKPAPPPQRAQIDGSGMSLALMALQEGKQFVQATTAVFEPALGEMPNRREAQSGRAILALQQQTDAGTSHYIQNLASISLQYEARVVLDLMPAIYDRPGRITRVLGGEDETKAVMLGKPFVRNQNGFPVPAQPNDPKAKMYDLRKGKYAISVDIGKSFQTRLEQGAAEMGEILSARPEMLPMIGDLYFQFRDFPGAKEIADRLKKIREKQFPGLGDDEEGGMSPEAAQAKMQGLEQQVQMQGAQMQAMVKALETEQVKQQARLAETQMKIQSEERIAAAGNETKLAIEGIKVQLEALLALQKGSHETARQHEQMAHEVALKAGAARTMTMSRTAGQDDESEEMGGGMEDPMMGGEA